MWNIWHFCWQLKNWLKIVFESKHVIQYQQLQPQNSYIGHYYAHWLFLGLNMCIVQKYWSSTRFLFANFKKNWQRFFCIHAKRRNSLKYIETTVAESSICFLIFCCGIVYTVSAWGSISGFVTSFFKNLKLIVNTMQM